MNFRQYLIEVAKEGGHAAVIRQMASDARKEWKGMIKQKPTSRMSFGDCDGAASHVAQHLRTKYPSATTIGPGGRHAWVAIPEIDHYVDPTYDQFHTKPVRTNKAGHFNNDSVKIGKLTTRLDDKDERDVITGGWGHHLNVDHFKEYWGNKEHWDKK